MINIQKEGVDYRVYRCSAPESDQATPFSLWYFENKSFFEAQLVEAEGFLRGLGSASSVRLDGSNPQLNIEVLDKENDIYKWRGSKLQISKNLIQQEDILKRSIVKFWVQQQWGEGRIFESYLFNEVWTDFLVSLMSGKSVVDSKEIESLQWPTVVKTKWAYCRSLWVFYEHLDLCKKMEERGQTNELDQVTSLSLRPFIYSKFQKAYQKLSRRDQYFLMSDLANLLNSISDYAQLESFQKIYLETDHPLKDWVVFQEIFIAMSEGQATDKATRNFLRNLVDEMKISKIDGFDDLKFEFVIRVPGNIKTDHPIVTQLLRQSKGKKVAIVDSERIWTLPEMNSLPLSAVKAWSSEFLMVEKCGDYSSEEVSEISKKSERTLFYVYCNDGGKKSLDISDIFNMKSEAFALNNPTISFLLVHGPSLRSRIDTLSSTPAWIAELRSEIHERNKISTQFGWRSVDWNAKLKVYEPVADIEGVQQFR